jgi:hypothetical protein
MRPGKNVQRTGIVATDPIVSDGPRASGSSATQPSTNNVEPEPDITNVEPGQSPRTSPSPQSEIYQNVLIECNALIEEYRKGKTSKPTVYSGIRTKLADALRDDTARIDAAFGSFIATVESHDSETAMAARRVAGAERERDAAQSPFTDVADPASDEEPVCKRPKVDESAFAWAGSNSKGPTGLSDNLVKTLELLGVYTVDPKATMRSLTNTPNCPEFPDSEWKSVIGGKAVNLDAILSGQLLTTNDDLKVEKFGDLELSFGKVEPTKLVKNGGEWSIAWNRAVRATSFAFPHRL